MYIYNYNILNNIKEVNKDVIFNVVTDVCSQHTDKYLPYDLFCYIWNKIDDFDEIDNHFIEDNEFYPNYFDIVLKGSFKRRKNKKPIIRFKKACRYYDFYEF